MNNCLKFLALNVIRINTIKSVSSVGFRPILAVHNPIVLGQNYLVTYKTPFNRSKKFEPSTVAVTKANRNLEVRLFDHEDKELGKYPLEKAKEMADEARLKLVIVEESDPPRFKLMTGNELFQLQMKLHHERKLEKESDNRILKEKEIDINLGIEDHDLQTKLKMAESFYEKGHSIKVKIKSKIINKKDRDIPKLQAEFIKKLEKLITFTKIKPKIHDENLVSIMIESKNTPQKPEPKPKKPSNQS